VRSNLPTKNCEWVWGGGEGGIDYGSDRILG
jgi:hypothetical protein